MDARRTTACSRYALRATVGCVLLAALSFLLFDAGLSFVRDVGRALPLNNAVVRLLDTGLRVSWISFGRLPDHLMWKLCADGVESPFARAPVAVDYSSFWGKVAHADIPIPVPEAQYTKLVLQMCDREKAFDVGAFFAAGEKTVLLLGDSQDGPSQFRRVLGAASDKQRALVVHLGDMVQDGASLHCWYTQFVGPLRDAGYLGSSVLLLTPGNHDCVDRQCTALAPMLATPETSYYAVRRFGVTWVVLDTNKKTDAQISWLESTLKANETKTSDYVVVLAHVPPVIKYWDPVAWKKESGWPTYMRTRVVPLLTQGTVDLVFSGHQHSFMHFTHGGVPYVVSGGAGGSLDRTEVPQPAEALAVEMKQSILEHHYVTLSIGPSSLTVTTQPLKGSPYQFVVPKRQRT